MQQNSLQVQAPHPPRQQEVQVRGAERQAEEVPEQERDLGARDAPAARVLDAPAAGALEAPDNGQ